MGQKKLTSNGSANRMSPRDIPTGEYYAMIIARLEREKGVLEKEVKRLRREVGILTKRNRKTGGEGGKEEIEKEATEGEEKREKYTESEAAPTSETRLRPEAKEFRPPVVPPPSPPPPPPSPTPSMQEKLRMYEEFKRDVIEPEKPRSLPTPSPEPPELSEKMDIDTPQASTTTGDNKKEGGKEEYFSNLPELWEDARLVRDKKHRGKKAKIFDKIGKFREGPGRLGSLKAQNEERIVWLYDNKRKYGANPIYDSGYRDLKEKDKVYVHAGCVFGECECKPKCMRGNKAETRRLFVVGDELQMMAGHSNEDSEYEGATEEEGDESDVEFEL